MIDDVTQTAAAQQMVTQLYLMDALALQPKSLISLSTLLSCLNYSEPHFDLRGVRPHAHVSIRPEECLSETICQICLVNSENMARTQKLNI